MSHFAKVKDGIVEQVICAEKEVINNFPDKESWIQTSYNTHGGVHYAPNVYPLSADGGEAINYNYAGIGYNWDGFGFYAPQPFPSWTLNKNTYLWEAPVPYPDDGSSYIWNEEAQVWNTLDTSL